MLHSTKKNQSKFGRIHNLKPECGVTQTLPLSIPWVLWHFLGISRIKQQREDSPLLSWLCSNKPGPLGSNCSRQLHHSVLKLCVVLGLCH